MNRMCTRIAFLMRISLLFLFAFASLNDRLKAQTPEVKAPPNHALLSQTMNGWYFVPKEFKSDYDSHVQRLHQLKSSLETGNLRVEDAQLELDELTKKLQILRRKLLENQVLVEGAKVHEQVDSIQFELGEEQMLGITANHVKLVGWNEKYVQVDLRKLVLSPDDSPVDQHLDAIKVVHKHGRAEFAGRTEEEIEASEKQFMAEHGSKLDEQGLENRRRMVESIHASYAIHRPFLGKAIDQISVDGLDYQSNSIVSFRVMSPGGDGRSGSVRQRYAEVTVHVPKCKAIAIRGARRGLSVEDIECDSLIIVDEDSTDTDHQAKFEVDGLIGNLKLRDFPIQRVVDVVGQVDIVSTTEFGVEGAGTRHQGDSIILQAAQPFPMKISGVSRGVKLHFGRVQLTLEEISGNVDVINEHGNTAYRAELPLGPGPHRIVTQSGRIEAQFSKDAWQSTPSISASSNFGTVRSNLRREEFDDFHLMGNDSTTGVRRNWNGFRKVTPNEDRFAVFGLIDRFSTVIQNQARSDGFDLISQSGSVEVLRK